MKKLIFISMIILLAGCTKQRDLYVSASPQIYAKGDWMPSLGQTDMTMNATAVAYPEKGEFIKEYFYAPDNVMLPVNKGIYDVMLFNGLMYSPMETHLDGLYFRGTENLSTFEAVAIEGNFNRRLTRTENEYIASNSMEIITSAIARQEITGEQSYFAKYKNGKNGFDTPSNYVEVELDLIPVALSYKAHIIATLVNVSSAYSASAALYGFVGSAFMGLQVPSHFYVTHQFNLNSKKILDKETDTGTIESPVFVTFGPPIDVPDQKYSIYLKIMLVNGEEMEWDINITDQIIPLIEMIKNNLNGTSPIQYGLEIPLVITLTLPDVEPLLGGIGIEDWEDDEIIKVVIPK